MRGAQIGLFRLPFSSSIPPKSNPRWPFFFASLLYTGWGGGGKRREEEEDGFTKEEGKRARVGVV